MELSPSNCHVISNPYIKLTCITLLINYTVSILLFIIKYLALLLLGTYLLLVYHTNVYYHA